MSLKSLIVPLFSLALITSCANYADNWTDRKMPGTPLEKWSFSIDGEMWEDVVIPHTYNRIDGHSKEYYRGYAHYRTNIPSSPKDSPRYLIFEGVGQSAWVVFEGDTLCYHSGGYTPFYVDITGKKGSHLEVICENTLNPDRIPLSADFNKNGGIHYPVWLLECPEVHISPEANGFYRLHVSTPHVCDSSTVGVARTQICNTSDKDQEVPIVWSLKDASGLEVIAHNQTVMMKAGTRKDVSWDFTLDNPHLWNGLKDPYLYTVSVQAGTR